MNNSQPAGPSPGLAVAMMLLAYLFFAGVDTNVKYLLGLGLPALQLAFLRYAGHFAISLAINRSGAALRAGLGHPQRGLLTLRALVLVAATIGNFIALHFLPLTTVSVIMFSAPIFVCLLSAKLLKEPVGPWRWAAILLGFAGVLIVIQPFGETTRWIMALPILNALGMALYSILTRQLAGSASPELLQLYTGAVGSVVILPLAIAVWVPPQGAWMLLAWFAIGAAGWAGHELLTRAHKWAEASLLMPFSYSLLLYVALADALLFRFYPEPREWVGIAVILGAGLVIWNRGRITRG